MTFDSSTLAVISGVAVTGEIIVFKYLTNKYDNINVDVLAWAYRIGSIFFISSYLIYETARRNGSYVDNAIDTLEMNKNTLWIILLSFLSGISIVTFFRSIDSARNAGTPVAIRSLYIPLTFLGVTFLITKNWSDITAWTYTGMSIIAIGIVLITYGSTLEKSN